MTHGDLEWLFGGASYEVLMLPEVAKAWPKTNAQDRARIERHMKWLAADGKQHLSPDKLKFEARLQVGNKKVPVYVFRAHQLRVYGGFTNIGGRPTFICTDMDVKKRDEADPKTLERAARKLAEFC